VLDGVERCELFLRLASRYRFDTPFYAGVGEADVAELYILLERLFPKVDDPVHESGEAHWIGPRESLGDIRTSVPMSVWVRLPPYKPCAGSSRRYPIWFGYLSN
jgi:hypothetical protein